MAALGNLARYRDIETLGSGGMATVVLAQDTLLGREVALKRMHTADPHGAERMRREALVGASISHPNLVSIYDVVTTDEGDVVIVMEYVAGENLRDALGREQTMPVAETLRVLAGVASGLDAIHELGIVHRDIKPANILLGRDGTVKIADLGIAASPDRTRITTVGTVLGSFSYMAPEQLEDAPITPAIDIYALATVAYEALSGVQAHRESTPIAVAHAIATQPPPDIRDVWPAAPAAVAELLRRGMACDPSERPRSASELIARLRGALQDQTTRRIAPTPPVGAAAAVAAGAPAAAQAAAAPPRRGPASAPADPPGARRTARILLPLALVLLALGVIAAVLVSGSGSSPPPATSVSHTSGTHTHRTASTHSAPAKTTSPTTSTPTNSTPTSSTPTSAATPPPSSGTATPPAGGASSPPAAVASFYELAASHRYAQAWALADPVFRNQLGGYDSFKSGQAGDRQIIFHTDRVISQSGHQATVQIATTSVRDNGTFQCHGTVTLQNASSSAWLLHAISINCG